MKAPDPAPPPAHLWHEVEHAVEAFERACHDGPADPADFCLPADDPLYLPVLVELLRADLEFAWAAGRPKRLDSYWASFRAVFAHADTLAQLAFEEYRLRSQAGESVTPAEYRDRYHIDTDGWESSEPSRTSVVGSGPADAQAAQPFPEAGESFGGFRVVRELGRGAFARVYLAEEAELAGRPVALKVVRGGPRGDQEPKTLARLQHTNIVPVYSVTSVGRFSAIVMPYFGATTLADVLRDRPASGEGFVSTVNQRKAPSTVPDGGADPLPVNSPPVAPTPLDRLRGMTHAAAALWVAAELAEGLAHAHDRGVLHRDLKPANVLIADDGRPMLLDFNLATFGADGRDLVGGTPSHMAPEHLAAVAGDPATVDARSDVYALGLMLYELLAGRPPTDAPTGTFRERVAKLRKDRAKPPPPARTWNPAVTPAVDAILAKCLAPSPASRYQSAHHLAEDLRRHLADLPLKYAREPSLVERFRKKLRRNPWAKSLPFLAAVALVGAAATLTALTVARRERERADAGERLRGFRPAAGSALARLAVPDPDPVALARDADDARAALARYGLPESDAWADAPAVRRLAAEDAERLRDDVTGLLVSLAHAERLLAERSADPGPRLAEAERLNKLAAAAAPDDRARWVAARQRAGLLERAGKADEAKAVRAALGPPPGVDAALYEATEAVGRNDFSAALAALRAAGSAAHSRPDYWFAVGRCLAELGTTAEAVAAFTTALALQPDESYYVRVRRGQAHLALKDYAAACADLDDAIRLRPDEPANYVDRGIARFRRGDNAGALADLDRALELWPTHTRIHFIRRQVRDRAGDKAGAARDLADGLAKAPGDETSWVTRGVHKLQRRDATGAVADFDAALKLDPLSKRAMQNKASALSENLGQPADAVKVLDALVKAHPDYVPGRAGRGVLHARLGNRAAAHADAVEVLKRDSAAFTRYQVAGIYALTSKDNPKDRVEAVRLLALAFRNGAEAALEKGDHDLDPVRADPTFQKLLDAARTVEGLAGR